MKHVSISAHTLLGESLLKIKVKQCKVKKNYYFYLVLHCVSFLKHLQKSMFFQSAEPLALDSRTNYSGFTINEDAKRVIYSG